MPLVYTLRPAFHLFADIVVAYKAQGEYVPQSVHVGFNKLRRIEAYAEWYLAQW